MGKILMRVVGLDGQIDLLPDRVVIHRDGLLNAIKFGFNATREIPLGAISEVSFRVASTFIFGSIEFVRSGRSVDEKNKSKHSTVKFNTTTNKEMEILKEKVFELMDKYNRKPQ
jgi:hypothetical protein